MDTPHYRPALPADIPEAAALFLTAVGDLAARHGLGAPTFTAASIEPVYRHILATGLFEVAEIDGRLAAICHAIVRDHQWFLSGFWALPGLQRRGLGGPLLRRVYEAGRAQGAELAFTWSSVDPAAMNAYMKLGMLPGYPILTFSGDARGRVRADTPDYASAPLDAPTAGAIDTLVRGTPRPVDHVFWLGDVGLSDRRIANAVTRGGEPVGYYYTTAGVIGPAAWTAPAHADAVLAHALTTAAAQADSVRVMIPGINHAAIRAAQAAGLRLAGFSHLLTSAPFGRFDQYLPSGPSLF